MALTNLLVAAVTCGLVGGALAWAELHAWPGLALVGLYIGAGLVASELAAAPVMWTWLGLRSGWVESLAMALALAVGLRVVCRLAAGGQDESI